MPLDPVDEFIAFVRATRRERELSAHWEDVVSGAQALHDAPGSERDRALFRPLDAATRSRFVDLVFGNAPEFPITPSARRSWVRTVTGIGALAAAAGLALYLGTATTNDASVEPLVLDPPPDVTLLGGHASTRAASEAPV